MSSVRMKRFQMKPPLTGLPEAERKIQSGYCSRIFAPGRATNGAIQSPGRKPADLISRASSSIGVSNLALWSNQSPTAL